MVFQEKIGAAIQRIVKLSANKASREKNGYETVFYAEYFVADASRNTKCRLSMLKITELPGQKKLSFFYPDSPQFENIL
jgi:hypothetical protein